MTAPSQSLGAERLRQMFDKRADMNRGMTAAQRLYVAVEYPELPHSDAIQGAVEEFEWLYDDVLPALLSEHDRLTEEVARLREALRGVIRVADRKTVEFDAARAALPKETT